ncbi:MULTISPECIES: TIGR03618 family F420-dependent PPOX class oxidoreductase [Microbacterium]|uniref:TIGR03618 family F420-dependent PPOX class oxidoreductase n=1 Tax=Microbacterium TaxID=33882 RepID=UPI000D659982|nr:MULTISPECIES: TIGR03618 family F420-dependent PPOX class oxidoreductase [Microbacterium]
MAAPFVLDPADERQAKALARLEGEEIGWLGTIGRDGFPHAVPVWFLWKDDVAYVFTQPGSAKAKNLRENPKAMLHLEAGDDGEQLHVLQGTVEISDEPTTAWLDRLGEAYLAKYGGGIQHLGWTHERMWAEYSLVLIFRPHKLIAW